jgi:Tfp pilus assembly protein PilV
MFAKGGGRDDERGESLLELMIAIVIIGIGVVAVVAGLATSIHMSDIHRKQATASATVRSFAEAIKNDVAISGYQSSCSPTYASTFAAPSASFATPQISVVRFWNGTSFPTGSCNAAADVGVEQLTLTVSSTDGRVSEKLVIVVRRPCTSTSDPSCT